jgi:hypothetical protein
MKGPRLSDSGNRGLYCARIWGNVPSGFSLVLGGDERTGHQMIIAGVAPAPIPVPRPRRTMKMGLMNPTAAKASEPRPTTQIAFTTL